MYMYKQATSDDLFPEHPPPYNSVLANTIQITRKSQ